jgi:hypothetical protein
MLCKLSKSCRLRGEAKLSQGITSKTWFRKKTYSSFIFVFFFVIQFISLLIIRDQPKKSKVDNFSRGNLPGTGVGCVKGKFLLGP